MIDFILDALLFAPMVLCGALLFYGLLQR